MLHIILLVFLISLVLGLVGSYSPAYRGRLPVFVGPSLGTVLFIILVLYLLGYRG